MKPQLSCVRMSMVISSVVIAVNHGGRHIDSSVIVKTGYSPLEIHRISRFIIGRAVMSNLCTLMINP